MLNRQRAKAAQEEGLAAAEQLAMQRKTYYQIFEQTPTIAILRGPEHRLEYSTDFSMRPIISFT